MPGLGQRRQKTHEDIDIDLVPIMNMFLVLIPFLLLSASFFHLRVINTSVPVLSGGAGDALKKKETKVTVIVEIQENGINLSAISDSLGEEELNRLGTQIAKKGQDEYPLEQMAKFLQGVKKSYPASNTLIIIPDEGVIYDTIIQTMDAARYSKADPLFPNVVLSGKVG